MRKYILTLVFNVFILALFAENEATNTITLNVVIPSEIQLQQGSKSILEQRLIQLGSKHGISGKHSNSQFVLTSNVSVVDKNITSTTPAMTALTLSVGVYIGNGVTGDLYGSHVIEVKGVGTNDTKAEIQAIKQLKADDPKLAALINESKKKIIDYYNSKCDQIIQEANNLKTKRDFEGALSILAGIPMECVECFKKASDQIKPIYLEHINNDCGKKLADAKAKWAAAPNSSGAEEVSYILEGVDPKSNCMGDISKLTNEIKERLLEVDNREWDFELKEQALEKTEIEAGRAIGVAFGENQPQNVTYNYSKWW